VSISAAEAADRHGDARRERCPQPCLQALDLAQDFGDAVQRYLGGEGEGQGEAVGASSYLTRQTSGCARFRRSCSSLVTLARWSRRMSTKPEWIGSPEVDAWSPWSLGGC